VIETAPFEVAEVGWGEFDIGIKVHFHDPREQPVSLVHHLRLFQDPNVPPAQRKPGIAACGGLYAAICVCV
jgi:transcription initiation factor IIF auxiliary subunit